METSLPTLVFYKATTFGAECEHHFGKQIFEVFKSTVRFRRVVADKFAVADIESGAIAMGALGTGIAVYSP